MCGRGGGGVDRKTIMNNLTNDTRLKPLIDEAIGIMSMAKPMSSYTVRALNSGGKDSAVSTDLSERYMSNFAGVAYVNTQTGPISQEHSLLVQAQAYNNKWHFLSASPATSYEMLVIKSGFPGPAAHSWMYQMLKERSIRQITKKARKSGQTLIYITGIRRAESQQRSNAPEITNKTKTEKWVSPLVNWEDEDIRNYMDLTGLKVPYFHHSVDCGCGAYAQPHEREEMLEHPKQKTYILSLESMVKQSRAIQKMQFDAGYDVKNPIPEAFCKWGHGLNGDAIKAPRIDAVSICNDCKGQLNTAGNVGSDPDVEMLRLKRIKEINQTLKT